VKSDPAQLEIFLPLGTTSGLWIVSRDNWNGVVLYAPRSVYDDLRIRPELDGPGVYLLIGDSDDPVFHGSVYIGEADELRSRLNEHQRSRDDWNKVVVVASTNNFLNKANIRYIENRLVAIATDSKQYEVLNGNQPQARLASESARATAENFLARMLLVYPILGVTAFEQLSVLFDPRTDDTSLLFLKGTANAIGRDLPDGFVVYKGAEARIEESASYPQWAKGLRAAMIKKGILVEDSGRYLLIENFTFSSPSAASDVFLGRSSNGRTEWKNADGLTLKELQGLAIE
jgi:hypothetical protein